MEENKKKIVGFSDDVSLIKAIAGGNKNAFAILAKKHIPIIYSVAFRMNFSKSEAEDIAQEVMLKIWMNAEKWDVNKKAKVSTWIYRITHNLCLDVLRKNKSNFNDNYMEIADKSDNAEAQYIKTEDDNIMQKLINELPERQRIALVFACYQELSYEEISHIMNTTVKSVESLLVRAKKNLRTQAIKSNLLDGGRK